MREACVGSLGWEDPKEKGEATHSSILPWRIPWTIRAHGVAKSRTRLSDLASTTKSPAAAQKHGVSAPSTGTGLGTPGTRLNLASIQWGIGRRHRAETRACAEAETTKLGKVKGERAPMFEKKQ